MPWSLRSFAWGKTPKHRYIEAESNRRCSGMLLVAGSFQLLKRGHFPRSIEQPFDTQNPNRVEANARQIKKRTETSLNTPMGSTGQRRKVGYRYGQRPPVR